MVERLAPVSTMNRKGPWPLIITGTTTRPMWSRVVGDANKVSVPVKVGNSGDACAGGNSEAWAPAAYSAPIRHTVRNSRRR